MPDLASTHLGNREWRLQNLYTILDGDGALVPFVPNAAQRAYYNRVHYWNLILKARKLGFSTFIEVRNLDNLLYNPNHTAGIVDKTMDDAKKKLAMMVTAYDHLDNGDLHPATWKIGRQIKKANPLVIRAKEELRWKNGSAAYCGVSLRGGTLQYLHLSELGYTAAHFPEKAEEIITGAINTLTPGNFCDSESTHEGGKIGAHYRLLKASMKRDPLRLTPKDFLFHFFAWWQDPRYVLDPVRPIRPEITAYFEKLTRELRITFTMEQMMFYDATEETQGHGMKKEYPSTPGEAFEAIAERAIYGTQMADLRAAGRISSFGLHADLPIYTFSDIGLSDFLSTWLVQPAGHHFLVLDWQEHQGMTAGGFADSLLLWERKWRKPITASYLPHDADRRSPNDGQSYRQAIAAAAPGRTIHVVPRTPDVWLGIGHVRELLPHCYFQKDFCDAPRLQSGEEHPSGVACLEGYQTAPAGSSGTLREMPLHDAFSHSADGFRTFAEAWKRGMVAPPSSAPPRAKSSRHHRR